MLPVFLACFPQCLTCVFSKRTRGRPSGDASESGHAVALLTCELSGDGAVPSVTHAETVGSLQRIPWSSLFMFFKKLLRSLEKDEFVTQRLAWLVCKAEEQVAVMWMTSVWPCRESRPEPGNVAI